MALTEYTDAEILIAIRAALYGSLTAEGKRITIRGRTLDKYELADLLALEKEFASRGQTAAQQRPAVASFRRPS